MLEIHIYMAAFLYPLYMILHSIASYRALWQLIVKPHFWEKTTHGLAQPAALQNLQRTIRIQPVTALAVTALAVKIPVENILVPEFAA